MEAIPNHAVLLLGFFTFGAFLISAASKPQPDPSRPSEAKSTSNLGGQMPASFDQDVARIVAEIDRIEAETLSKMKETSLDRETGRGGRPRSTSNGLRAWKESVPVPDHHPRMISTRSISAWQTDPGLTVFPVPSYVHVRELAFRASEVEVFGFGASCLAGQLTSPK